MGKMQEEYEAPCISDGWWSSELESYDGHRIIFTYIINTNKARVWARDMPLLVFVK